MTSNSPIDARCMDCGYGLTPDDERCPECYPPSPPQSPVTLTSERRPDRDEYVFTLRIRHSAIIPARLDRLDRALLADCAKPDATVADSLLALETLVRRIEESG